MADLELLDLPESCLALTVEKLDAGGKLGLFRVSHATRRLVLSHAARVSMTVGVAAPLPGSKRDRSKTSSRDSVQVLASLIEVPHDQPCFRTLRLRIREDKLMPLLSLMPMLQSGRVQELELQVPIMEKLPAAKAAAACKGVRKLTLRNSTAGHFLPAIAYTCTRLRHLTLDSLRGSEFIPFGLRSYFSRQHLPDALYVQTSVRLPPGCEVLVRSVDMRMDKELFIRVACVLESLTVWDLSAADAAHLLMVQEMLRADALRRYKKIFQRLHTLRLNNLSCEMSSSLQFCSALTHIYAHSVQPPLQHPPAADILGLRPPALQQLSLVRLQVSHLFRMPWILTVKKLQIKQLVVDVPHVAAMKFVATALSRHPELCIGSSKGPGNVMVCLVVAESTVDMLDAIKPLAHHFHRIMLLKPQLSIELIAGMGKALGGHVQRLGMVQPKMLVGEASEQMWLALLAAIPHVVMLSLASLDGPVSDWLLPNLAVACEISRHRLVLVMDAPAVSLEQAAALSNRWLRVQSGGR